ncbi:MAG: TetR/AcrR family transcriptional regulator [Eubacteriales bacterium]
MARNKYPEQTIERILEVSKRLFLEKGYDNTSIQDIINELEGLTKGAIYHHFKSKEDIFDAVATKMGEVNGEYFIEMRNNTSLTGAEKLREVIRLNIGSEASSNIMEIMPNLMENPKFLAMQMKSSFFHVVPNYLLPIVEQGVEDGSIICDKPYELAEMIVLFLNTWLNPVMLGTDKSRIANKCKMINEMMTQYHIFLFDDEMIKKLESFTCE